MGLNAADQEAAPAGPLLPPGTAQPSVPAPPPAPLPQQAPVPTAVNAPLDANSVLVLLASPKMRYEREFLLRTPNIGNDLGRRQMIADMYNAIAPRGTLTDAILHLEDAFWNLGQALQDWQRVERLLARGPGTLVQDTFNSRLDRTNARGGRHFEESKFKITVKTRTGDQTFSHDRANFDRNNPRDVLRLNRRRQEFIDRTIGPIPCPPQGKVGEWWHELEKWEVEQRYLSRDRHAAGFPNWSAMADEHNRAFAGRRLPGSVELPPDRPTNKVTQHINRAALNKHKDKGNQRHKYAQRDLEAEHQQQRQQLSTAWQEGFSATQADVSALDQEDAAAAAPTVGSLLAPAAPSAGAGTDGAGAGASGGSEAADASAQAGEDDEDGEEEPENEVGSEED